MVPSSDAITKGLQEHLRLELVKLVHRFDQSPAVLIERATALEAWITGHPAQPTTREGRRSKPEANE